MQIRILADDDELSLAGLQAWLQQDPGTARLPVTPIAAQAAPTMSVMDALDVVLSNGIAIANFAVAYSTWREAKAHTPGTGAMRLVYGSATVDIGHLSSDELARLLQELSGQTADGDVTE